MLILLNIIAYYLELTPAICFNMLGKEPQKTE